MTDARSELLQGTLDMLILKALAVESLHGWGIGERLERMSGDFFRVPQGSLYPAFERLLNRGWIRSEWRITDNNRKARYYIITRAGQTQLRREREHWARTSAAIDLILRAAT